MLMRCINNTLLTRCCNSTRLRRCDACRWCCGQTPSAYQVTFSGMTTDFCRIAQSGESIRDRVVGDFNPNATFVLPTSVPFDMKCYWIKYFYGSVETLRYHNNDCAGDPYYTWTGDCHIGVSIFSATQLQVLFDNTLNVRDFTTGRVLRPNPGYCEDDAGTWPNVWGTDYFFGGGQVELVPLFD